MTPLDPAPVAVAVPDNTTEADPPVDRAWIAVEFVPAVLSAPVAVTLTVPELAPVPVLVA